MNCDDDELFLSGGTAAAGLSPGGGQILSPNRIKEAMI